jgi:Dyp-type peroxidase family
MDARRRRLALARSIRPNAIIRDPRAEAILIFVTLRADLNGSGAQAWLQRASELVSQLESPGPKGRVARVVTALGRSFFIGAGEAPRFEIDPAQAPIGLRQPLGIPELADPLPGADVLFYVMSTSEAPVAAFLDGLSATRGLGLTGVSIERGFQRDDRRELFGFLDGVRNVRRPERHAVIYVDRDVTPEEPVWTEDGSYLAYLKIRQDLDRARQLSAEERERIMGRREADGSRLDQPPGSSPHAEGDFTGEPPVAASHVRKSGPRGPRDAVQIFRRGVPYLTLDSDGRPNAGLHFVSFQASPDQFEAILQRWMLNPGFPAPGAGPDLLFASGLVSLERGGLFFVPPHDGRFIGASLFDAPRREPRPRRSGRLVVRKRAVDANGQPALVELSGFRLQVLRADDRSPVGDAFETNPAGRAISPDLPVRTPLLLTEISQPLPVEPPGEIPFVIDRRRQPLEVVNRLRQPGPYGG